MTFVHPQLQAVLDASRGQPGIADVSVEAARAQIVARTASRPRGPEVVEVRDLAIPRSRGQIPMRLYRPDRPAGVAVVFHGGGWMVGSRDSFDATSRHLALDSGLAIVSVEYRLAPEHPFPAAVEDAWTATRWVAENSNALGVDTSRLVVLGESAGGNLAAVVALMARDAGFPKIRLQVLVYPAVDARLQGSALDQFAEGYLQTKRDVLHAFRTYGLGSIVDASDWRLSPLLAPLHADVAPALIISAECDAMRDDSAAYARRLLESGVRCSHVRYETMLHLFFGMRGVLWEAELAQMQVAGVMRDAVRGAD